MDSSQTQLRRQVYRFTREPQCCHFAPKKLMQRVSQYYYWPGMKGQVCKSYVACLSTQGHERRSWPPECIDVGEPFECIRMDI